MFIFSKHRSDKPNYIARIEFKFSYKVHQIEKATIDIVLISYYQRDIKSAIIKKKKFRKSISVFIYGLISKQTRCLRIRELKYKLKLVRIERVEACRNITVLPSILSAIWRKRSHHLLESFQRLLARLKWIPEHLTQVFSTRQFCWVHGQDFFFKRLKFRKTDASNICTRSPEAELIRHSEALNSQHGLVTMLRSRKTRQGSVRVGMGAWLGQFEKFSARKKPLVDRDLRVEMRQRSESYFVEVLTSKRFFLFLFCVCDGGAAIFGCCHCCCKYGCVILIIDLFYTCSFCYNCYWTKHTYGFLCYWCLDIFHCFEANMKFFSCLFKESRF